MRLRLFVLGLALVGLVAATAGTASAEVLTARDSQAAAAVLIRSAWNGKCLEAFGNYDGALVGMNTCTGATNQQWYADGTQIRSSQRDNRCLEVLNYDPFDGAYVGIYECWGGTNQQWYIWGGNQIRSPLNAWDNKCLEIYGPYNDNGARAGMWSCYGAAHQRWY